MKSDSLKRVLFTGSERRQSFGRFVAVLLLVSPAVVSSQVERVPDRPPPLPDKANLLVVDEPESAFYSLGRSLWHLGRNADMIMRFHEWLAAKGHDLETLLPHNLQVPRELHRILLEPERVPQNGWRIVGDWITSKGSHRGPAATLPLRVRQGGRYRVWIRYQAYDDGTAVTRLQIWPARQTTQQPLVDEEFNTQVASESGPRWHSFITDLEAGEYTIRLGHVVRYYHVAADVPFKEHRVDCLYFTEELWAEPPSDELRLTYQDQSLEAQVDTVIPHDAEQKKWRQWHVRPLEWEEALQQPRLFNLGYIFWREYLRELADMDYRASPTDPVRKGIADYRDPRRQVVFDPVWNMVANPYRAAQQVNILRSDVDDQARDAFFGNLAPGQFPVVLGQWQRAGGGLKADHGARNGNAMELYSVPHAGKWHLWTNFKNINYFEYFGIRVQTAESGQVVDWQRTERNYPGARSAWAKVGIIDVAELSKEEEQEQRVKSAAGLFVREGTPHFVHLLSGEWIQAEDALVNQGENAVLQAPVGLPVDASWRVRARVTIPLVADETEQAAAFLLHGEHGLIVSRVGFDGTLSGSLFAEDQVNPFATWIQPGQPLSFEIQRQGKTLTFRSKGHEPVEIALKTPPSGRFGFHAGNGKLKLHEFSASGALTSSLEMRLQVYLDLYMDRYINPRTYRGVYGLRITDDEAYVPEGNVAPVLSPRRYQNTLMPCAISPDAGYVMNLATGVGTVGQTWMPTTVEPAAPAFQFTMARDAVRSATVRFRNMEDYPIVLHPRIQALQQGKERFPAALSWRVVSFVPYGARREEWSPFFLLRRPIMVIPPRGAAQLWLTVDNRGLPAGDYQGMLHVEAMNYAESRRFPARAISVALRVADVKIEPHQPILLHGWTQPPAGDEYRDAWFRRFNVWQGPLLSKEEAQQRGVRLQVIPQWDANARQIRERIERAQGLGLEYADFTFSIADEPTGTTLKELAKFIHIAKLIREADPQVRITMNPGEAARAATFRILQPYVDLWNPYALHLTYGPSGRDYLKKPWIWYTTPCYQDKTPGIAGQMYNQIRSVLSQPGDCLGTALFAPYYPWRDPWDTAYEHISDVAVFFAPSRHGLVATPAWEALLEATQHANLARMVREQALAEDAVAKALWEKGSSEELIAWLESNRGATPFPTRLAD